MFFGDAIVLVTNVFVDLMLSLYLHYRCGRLTIQTNMPNGELVAYLLSYLTALIILFVLIVSVLSIIKSKKELENKIY